ncbi:MAG: hypothetical protein O3A46_03025 [Candidatus Poribacteria bacterium]|nr:hypothetical protein [Candidatus Poribacteria bacterium]
MASSVPSIETTDDLVNEAARRAVLYFWQEANPHTGLVKDRAVNFAERDEYVVSSVAATGFGLVAVAVGAENGWLPREDARARTETTLRFFRDESPHEHGWFYHFVHYQTGERYWDCELSSIDTALLLAGALFAAQYWGDEIAVLADDLYERVDFNWMLTDGGARPDSLTLNHGWKPESGFLAHRWGSYSELMVLYLLGIGSPTHPIPPETWGAWKRPTGEYGGYETFYVGPLFTHQFSHAFIDFGGKRDALGWDYWRASVNATLGNRQFCIDHADEYASYGENSWGLSACDAPDGYRAYGAPPGYATHDGTVATLAMIASLPFAPDETRAAMSHLYRTHGDRHWGKYGFGDSFNLDRNWFAEDVIGIDLGAWVCMWANARDGFVWGRMMRHPAVERAMDAVGFREDTSGSTALRVVASDR